MQIGGPKKDQREQHPLQKFIIGAKTETTDMILHYVKTAWFGNMWLTRDLTWKVQSHPAISRLLARMVK